MSYTLRIKKGLAKKAYKDVIFHSYDANTCLLQVQREDRRVHLINNVKEIEIDPNFFAYQHEVQKQLAWAKQQQQQAANNVPPPGPVQAVVQAQPVVQQPPKTMAQRALENVMKTPVGQRAVQAIQQQQAPVPQVQIPEWALQNTQPTGQESPEQIMERIEQGAPGWPSLPRNLQGMELQEGAH